MLVLHVCIECSVRAVGFSAVLNRTEKLFGYLLIFAPMNFGLIPIHIIKVLSLYLNLSRTLNLRKPMCFQALVSLRPLLF